MTITKEREKMNHIKNIICGLIIFFLTVTCSFAEDYLVDGYNFSMISFSQLASTLKVKGRIDTVPDDCTSVKLTISAQNEAGDLKIFYCTLKKPTSASFFEASENVYDKDSHKWTLIEIRVRCLSKS